MMIRLYGDSLYDAERTSESADMTTGMRNAYFRCISFCTSSYTASPFFAMRSAAYEHSRGNMISKYFVGSTRTNRFLLNTPAHAGHTDTAARIRMRIRLTVFFIPLK